MATLNLDKPETVRKAADQVVAAGETLVEDVKVLKAKAVELLDDGTRAARKAYSRKVRELDDLKDEAALTIRKAPWTTVGVTFGVGLLLGLAAGLVARRAPKA